MNGQLTSYFPPRGDNRRRKGRSEELLAQRDEKLAVRFYYYCHIRGDGYETTITSLVNEFDICERVVIDRLKANQPVLDELFTQKPPVTHLKRKIPHFAW